MRGWAIVAAVLAACGGDPDGGPLDAGLDASGDDAGFDVAEPEPPVAPEAPAATEPPRMTPCPAGWREVVDPDAAEVVTCDPWPASGPEDCAAGEAHFPGGAGCERIGAVCPEGDYADGIVEGPDVLHVLAGADPGGDGTLGAPFATIGEAIAAAPDGALIALSKGTFDEVVTVDRPLTLQGACVAETIVAPSVASETEAVLTLTGDGATVRDLQVAAARLGVVVEAADGVRMESVLVAGAQVAGVRVDAAAVLAATDLVVRDTGARPSDGMNGYGLEVIGGGRADLARAAFERNTTIGITVDGVGAELSASDLVVRDTLSRPSDLLYGSGVGVRFGARVALTRAALEHNRGNAMAVRDEETVLQATDVIARDTQTQELDGIFGGGLEVWRGARAELTRVTLERNHTLAIHAYQAGTEVIATDLVVVDTLARAIDGRGGEGLEIDEGVHAELTRAAFGRNRSEGLDIRGAGTVLVATDVAVRDMRTREDMTSGVGLVISGGARAELLRGLFERGRYAGLLVMEPGSTLAATDLHVEGTRAQEDDGLLGCGLWASGETSVQLTRAAFVDNEVAGIYANHGAVLVAEDLAIRDTRAQETDGGFGNGLLLESGATVELHRAALERNRFIGIQVGGAVLTAEDVVIRDTLSRSSDGAAGYGLAAAAGGVAELTRAAIEGNRGVGVLSSLGIGAFDRAQVTLTDAVVAGTLEKACAEDGCVGLGIGLGAREGAIVATRFRVSDNALCGVQVTGLGVLDLHEGEISRNPIGANVQVDSFDLSRIEDDVRYLDNERNLDSSVLAVPDVVDDLDLEPEPLPDP